MVPEIIPANPTPTETPAPVADPVPAISEVEAQLATERAEKEALRAQLKAQEEKTLTEKEQWRELAERREKELNERILKDKQRDQAILEDKKSAALREAAIKAGIKQEALADLELIELSDCKAELSATGRVVVTGAQKAIDGLKTLRPFWFGTSAPNINSSAPGISTTGQLTVQDLMKLEAEAKKDPSKYGDYKAAVLKFKGIA